MNKKEKEQKELNELLKECINEQINVGLKPIANIEIYFNFDSISKSRCSSNVIGTTCFDLKNSRTFILIRRKYFGLLSIAQKKRLIHHELIHCNLNEKGEPINHINDGMLFSECSQKIDEAYHINPMETHHKSCFDFESGKVDYNYTFTCRCCGYKSHFVLKNESTNVDFNKSCPNCGKKLIYEKKTSI